MRSGQRPGNNFRTSSVICLAQLRCRIAARGQTLATRFSKSLVMWSVSVTPPHHECTISDSALIYSLLKYTCLVCSWAHIPVVGTNISWNSRQVAAKMFMLQWLLLSQTTSFLPRGATILLRFARELCSAYTGIFPLYPLYTFLNLFVG